MFSASTCFDVSNQTNVKDSERSHQLHRVALCRVEIIFENALKRVKFNTSRRHAFGVNGALRVKLTAHM